jgi:hypothetical protein
MCPPTKLRLPIFDTINVTTLYHAPVLSRFISARLFSVPKLKMKLKGHHFADAAEVHEAITDELKKAQKDDFLAAF